MAVCSIGSRRVCRTVIGACFPLEHRAERIGRELDDHVDVAPVEPGPGVGVVARGAGVVDEPSEVTGVALHLLGERAALRRDEQRAVGVGRLAVAEAEGQQDQERPEHQHQHEAGLVADVDGLLAEEAGDLGRPAQRR